MYVSHLGRVSDYTMPTRSSGVSLSKNIPPYVLQRVDKMPGLQATKFTGIGKPVAKGRYQLPTPPDMDGHFLQKFDNDLLKNGANKSEVLAQFL